MNEVRVSVKGDIVAVRAFLSARQVFTTADLAVASLDTQTDRNLLARAVRRGQVDRVRRGLYVSKVGRFEGVPVNPPDVAVAVAPDAVFCYMTALQFHGVSHDVIRVTQFRTAHHLASFTYAHHEYVPMPRGGSRDVRPVLTVSGHSYQVTTREQTVVDCVSNISLGGGVEHVLRSMGFVYLDLDRLLRLAGGATASTRARLGWLLDAKSRDWKVPADTLDALSRSLGRGPYYLGSARTGDTHWVRRWKLLAPFPDEEMRAWMTP